jgi:Na+-translocating ferredoxin:NAD+ oxidoreductase RnfG subunit
MQKTASWTDFRLWIITLVLCSVGLPSASHGKDEVTRLTAVLEQAAAVREAVLPESKPACVVAMWIAYGREAPVGYALRLKGATRSGRFQVFVIADEEFKIQKMEVDAYQGVRGAGVRRSSFARQFSGKTSRSPMIVGHDVIAVTGATLSSRSVTGVVRQGLRWLAAWHRRSGDER